MEEAHAYEQYLHSEMTKLWAETFHLSYNMTSGSVGAAIYISLSSL